MKTGLSAAKAALAPRQGNISDAETKYYIRKARNLRAQAFHDVARALLRGVGQIAGRGRRAGEQLRHNAIWRAPGSGNCLNC